jgi:hypothetical protein
MKNNYFFTTTTDTVYTHVLFYLQLADPATIVNNMMAGVLLVTLIDILLPFINKPKEVIIKEVIKEVQVIETKPIDLIKDRFFSDPEEKEYNGLFVDLDHIRERMAKSMRSAGW